MSLSYILSRIMVAVWPLFLKEGNTNKITRANRRNAAGVPRYALNYKKDCKGAVRTDLEVAAVIDRKHYVETCRKPISTIYHEEAYAGSAEPSTSGQVPGFKLVRTAMHKHQAKRIPRLRHNLVIPDQFKTMNLITT
ncbi:hypothetical protein T4C_10352 [Trichinella pseudospiralis]|uniref:Uncharacterized protein n=1 Tax=Trichinella pseudospiralis TaxID=6337 RepID=A0A0V1JW59_TRIPS|nr:hypothetical protein T4C_10352 [Trichinella pseudospiralis]